ncbi:hypothetical protein BDW22DRAFT_951465 [Trametopsis cervina]|nr:hypothetical protein BDW22DRAFT_951465 [Trametopsis cervina]
MTDPPPKKIGSLRDRIAAFENKGPAPVPSPPQPRPKPAGGVSWKPRAASPPPPAEENVEKKTGGMSAADAKQSISKGGSLKDRMAALQGLNTFGGAAPVTPPPRPSSEKPKWKPPPVVSPPVEEDELAESKLNETPTSPTEDVNESVGERDASQTEPAVEEPVETSAEEEERQRRAALAARMARLGGARVGMGPPVFAKKPDIKKTETPKSDEPKSSETEDVLSPPKIQSPPVETASPPVQESSGEYFADVNTSTASLLSADSVDTTGSTPRSPAMPVPAVPRRAAPPRRKTPKSPAPPISDAPLTASPAAGTPQETSDEKSKELQEDVRKSKEDEVSLGLAPEPLSGDSRHLDKVEQGEPVEPVTAEAPTEESQHIGAVHDDVHDTSTSEKAHSDDNDVGKLPAIEASAVDDDTRALFYTEEAEQSSEPEVEEEHDDTPAAPENVHSAAIQEPATGNEEEEEDTLVAPEPEEEDEAARRKRIADRLRQQGGFNPFAAPPIRKASVSPTELTSQTTTADEPDVPSPLPPRRQSTRQGSTDSYSALSSAGSGRRTSVQSITSPVAEAVVPPVSFSPKPTEPESIQDGNIVAEQEELEEKPDDPDSMLSENAYALSHTLHAEPESEVEDANEVYREMSPDSYHEPLRHDQELSRDEDEYVESTIEQAQREEDIHVPAPAAEPAPPPPPRRVSLPPPKRASLPPPPRAIPAIPQEPSASSPIISPVSAKSAYSPVEPQHIGGGNAVEESLPASQHQPAPAQTQPRLHVDVGQTEAEGSVEASAIPSHELPYVPPRRLSTEIPRRALPPPPTVLPPTVEVETNAEGDDVQELAAESSDYSEEDEAPLAPPEEEELSRDPEPETVSFQAWPFFKLKIDVL